MEPLKHLNVSDFEKNQPNALKKAGAKQVPSVTETAGFYLFTITVDSNNGRPLEHG